MITIDVLGHVYDVPEPKGAAAMELFSMAMDAMEAKGAREVLDRIPFTADKAERNALGAQVARRLAASPAGVKAMQRTLLGGKYDGERITPDLIEATFSKPGRFTEPYAAAVTAWSRLGFFFDAAASSSEAPEEEADPSGDD